jgi:isoaspartyl peptidase/L-asparaginase-like protein (Ntn-hydrolase superfamily)
LSESRFPIVISTWPFGMAANEAAWKILSNGAAALDAVEAGIVQCEDDPAVDSVGFGGLPDASGNVTLDASIMDDRGRCGAVACLYNIRNPIRVARMVMERTPHVMLVGEAATRFALDQGMKHVNLLAPEAGRRFDQWRRQREQAGSGHDTIGMLAIDSQGKMAGGCSTSGTAFKLPGRVGDSPIIGAGLYVDGGIGGAAATGTGEEMVRACGSFAIVEKMRRGLPPREAIAEVLQDILRRRGNADVDVSFLALRRDGEFAGLTLRAKTNFRYAFITPGDQQVVEAQAIASDAA